jgi:hypothetical protein
MLDEAIDRLDLRRLKNCTAQQRVDTHGIAERLREVRADVTAARTRDTLTAAEARARDPLQRAGELHQQIEQERIRRLETENRLKMVQRTRSPERARSRELAVLIRALLPGANGAELQSLEQQSQQLLQARPTSEAERLRAIKAAQAREIEIVRRINPRGY